MLRHHLVPLRRIALLEGEAFGVRPVAEDHGIPAFVDRPENVRPQHEAVVHWNGDVPVDPHPVSDFALDLLLDHAHGPNTSPISKAGTAFHSAEPLE
jgi:hypothetical protein